MKRSRIGPVNDGDPWTADHVPDLSGRRALVTGANSGLGFETTKGLAFRGAEVLMAVRDLGRGAAARDLVRSEQPAARVELLELDLGDLRSVHAATDRLRGEGRALDVLVNNAGSTTAGRELTPQGHELMFATAHLGHFALTAGVFGLLGRAPAARVVTVSSGFARRGEIAFDDLASTSSFSALRAYRQAKLANLLFALELDRRLRARGSAIASLAAHPGFTATPGHRKGSGVGGLLVRVLSRLSAQPAATGTLPQLRAATDQSVPGGRYLGPEGPGERRGHPVVVTPPPAALDEAVARRLWEVSEQLTGVTFGLPAAGASAPAVASRG